jgi:thiamine-phosphate pyrophosphorylase
MRFVRNHLPERIAMTDARRGIDPLEQIGRLTRGDALVFRHYELKIKERFELAAMVQDQCKENDIRFLVAGDWKLAMQLRSDGLHLPQWYLRKGYSWHQKPMSHWLVTGSAHSGLELEAAAEVGCDAAILSPVFPTKSHENAKTLGVTRFASLCVHAPLPVFGLGGITRSNRRRLHGAGAAGIAGVGLS